VPSCRRASIWWITFRYDGEDLEAEHGGPARLLVPHLYLWKSATWVRWIQLLDQDEPWFWESLGYHMPGWCHERPGGRSQEQRSCVMDGATVSVAVVASRTEAEVIAGMLRSHGVSAAVSADDAGGQYPQMQIDGVRVLVAPADEASARRLLAIADDDTANPQA
jgi:hypothetical protein